MGGGGLAQAATAPRLSVTADTVNDWAGQAKPGDELVYHSGAFLVKSLAAVRAADALIARGEAIPIQRRRGDAHFDYCLQKRRNAEARPISCAAVGREAPDRAFADSVVDEAEQLLAVLRRLANFSKPCPPYRELAVLAQLKDAEAARYRMKLLIKAERIRVVTPDEGPLVVTIVSSGRSTAK